MAEDYERFVRSGLIEPERADLQRVDALALQLSAHLRSLVDHIDTIHVHGARSSVIQEVVSRLLKEELGFAEEVVLTPEHGFVTQARPDFYYSVGEGRGVLAEVERGGATTNNHDLKDVWKAHIAPDAQHLFLVVPHRNFNKAGLPREKPFRLVSRRIGAFFGDPRREIDVVSAHVFGYGTVG